MEAQVNNTSPPLLATKNLTKKFGSLIANNHLNIDIYAGEIHAVLGENGAGKSTLMKMLYGLYQPDGGMLFADGKVVEFHSPNDARAHNIGMVFQNFRLIPALTVWENVALALRDLKMRLSSRKIKKGIREIAEKYHLAVDPEAYIWQLDIGQRQRVEIVKVLLTGARVLLLDEPTSVLAVTEVASFLEMLRRLRDEGYALLFVTHKVQEVLQCADRVTVMQAGQVVYSSDDIASLDEKQLVTHMVGEWTPPATAVSNTPSNDSPILEVKDLTYIDERGYTALEEINFTIASGEIVGVAGISGNGQLELSEALLGLLPLTSGEIFVDGKLIPADSPATALAAGVSGIPQDPIEEAIVPGLSVLEHMVLGGIEDYRAGLNIDWPRVESEFKALPSVNLLNVAAPERQADQLSGGNVQRMMISRSLAAQPKVLIASYPSRGLDVATARQVHRLLLERRDEGVGILVFSEDLSELYAISDRLLVLAHGRISESIDPQETDAYAVAEIMVSRSHGYDE